MTVSDYTQNHFAFEPRKSRWKKMKILTLLILSLASLVLQTSHFLKIILFLLDMHGYYRKMIQHVITFFLHNPSNLQLPAEEMKVLFQVIKSYCWGMSNQFSVAVTFCQEFEGIWGVTEQESTGVSLLYFEREHPQVYI